LQKNPGWKQPGYFREFAAPYARIVRAKLPRLETALNWVGEQAGHSVPLFQVLA
jgi:hypothetical protein